MAVALPIIGIALAVGGGAMGAYAANQQGKAEHGAAKYNQKIANRNAELAATQAKFDAGQLRRQRLILTGKQRAAAASSGLFLSGSFNDVIADSAVQAELEVMSRIYQGQVESSNYRSEAALHRAAARNAADNARFQAYGSIISGLGGAAMAGSALTKAPSTGSGGSSGSGYGGARRSSGLATLQNNP